MPENSLNAVAQNALVADQPAAMGDRGRQRKMSVVAILVVLAVAALMWSFRWGGPIDLRYDAGVYYALGTSISTGAGYRIVTEPGAPEGIQYPPGLPALVALHQKILGTTDVAVVAILLKRTYAVLFFALALATWRLARNYLGVFWSMVAAVLCVLQLNTYFLSNLLFTELPYTLVCVCLALLVSNESRHAHTTAREIVGFALAATAFLLRTAGLALLIAWVAEAWLRRRWRLGAARAILAAIPFVAWNVHVTRVQNSDAYQHPAYAYQRASYQFYNVSYAENLKLIDPFKPELGQATVATMLARAQANLMVLPLAMGEAASEARGFWAGAIKFVFFPGRKIVPWVENLVLFPIALIAALALAGWMILLRRRSWFVAILIVTSVALVGSTPWPQQFLRYLAPLSPFISIVLVIGFISADAAIRRTNTKWLRAAGWLGLSSIAVGTFSAHAFAALNSVRTMNRVAPMRLTELEGDWSTRRWFYYDQQWADWDRAISWIARNSSADAVIATNSPHLAYLLSGRHAVMPPMEADPAKAEQLMREVPVSFVVIDDLAFMDIARRYALPAVASRPNRWRPVQSFNKTTVYQREATTGE